VLSAQFVPGVGRGLLALRLAAPGVADLRVQIVLYDELPWIDLVYDMQKLPVTDPESVYIAFPLNLAAATPRYEAAAAIVEAEAQQIAIACRDFYAVQRWVDLSDTQRGVTVAMPDTPIAHFGGFTNHRYLERRAAEQPLLLSWPLNNHWFTNFCVAQQGWMRFRYRLVPHSRPFDPVAATRIGAEAAVEPLVGPVWDRPAGMEHSDAGMPASLPAQAGLLTLTPDHVQLIGLRPAADGRGVIAHLQEISGIAGEFELSFPHAGVAAAECCDLMGAPVAGPAPQVDDRAVRGAIEPYRLQTIRIVFR